MTTDTLRTFYDQLPEGVKKLARYIRDLTGYVPGTSLFKTKQWARNHYHVFVDEQKERIFLAISRFANINRPIDGYYFEFGCHSGRTMRMAYDHFHYLHQWDYVAFDSFEGLPEIAPIDEQAIWEKGKLKTDEQAFIKLVTRHGMPKEKLRTVKGFYDESLTTELQSSLLPKKAAVVYIDCDLYASTIPILKFIVPFLQRGTIIVFDDWYCFHGDPNRGEQLAFSEFRSKYPKLRFKPFVSTSELQSFIYLGEEEHS